jgi:hypothetical protein
MDQGAWIAFARGSESLLSMTVGDSYAQTRSEGKVTTFAALFNTPPNGSLMGKPINKIGEAEYLQVEFLGADMPANAKIVGGKITFTINGNQGFEFEVPEQISDGKKVFVRDLSSLKSKLTTSDVMPPEPTLGTEASPH